MELKLNKQARWSQKHLDFLIMHREAYGVDISEEAYNKEISNINRGEATLRCTKNQKCYEIYNEEVYIGDIVLEEDNEISIIIFDEYSGKGHAYNAITLLIEEKKKNYLEAVVRPSNQNKNIKKLLSKLGFINKNEVWVFKKEVY
ncbi:GNAT family N-acetyltransferase [Clostridium algidicarnis]|uniref:GNAT family N-acetyltransferase n=1 Tax=Clostridium algidicarnis TaxID=37659 RepID=UPI001C0D65E6|nr:GNAT family N-acetyltransferase [Clostridium algidicarnis]MBU3204707.1 N-acetyltransferase [Clostridium algidicarnis]MBU3212808.1 N-acetyltransferase [Clostridium algidicarnis]MBU3223452.1 N-acetyltransferase [Clostridium algidicarnis]